MVWLVTLEMTSEEIQEFYFVRLAAAFVRGSARLETAEVELDSSWLEAKLEDLDDEAFAGIVADGLDAGLRLHRFKRTMKLARVEAVLGTLRGFAPASLLDVGSGRGAFLWPLIDAFPRLPVTVVELREDRVSQLNAVAAGGVERLSVCQGDISLESEAHLETHDLVTALEVWEHIPQVEQAARRCVELARRAVIATVPSKEDDNPEHIHLLNRDRILELFDLPRVKRVRFDAVPGHLIAVATLQDDG